MKITRRASLLAAACVQNNGFVLGEAFEEEGSNLKAFRRSSTNGNSMRESETIDDLKKLRNLTGLFEGDIVPDYDSIVANYGLELAEKLIEDGILDAPTENQLVSQNIVTNRRWEDRYDDIVEVPYEIDNGDFSSSQIQKIKQAIKTLADRSKVVKFVPRNGQSDYLYVMQGSGCSSFVGPFGGKQEISLSGYCASSTGVIQHEFMHALGLYHEQSRPDRDSYVDINWENIQGGTSNNNFAKKTNTETLGGTYDYGSVMHYPEDAFSKNGRDTITPTRSTNGANIGQRSGADEQDIIDIRLLYQCKSGPRKFSEYNSNRCTSDCKCWEDEVGCNGNDDACQGSLTCRNNRCGNGGFGGPSPTRPSPTPTRPSPTRPSPTNPNCQDSPRNWHDKDGERYNCKWYSTSNFCERFGDLYFDDDGISANEACCTCGGGAPVGGPRPTPTRPNPPTRPSPTRPSPSPTNPRPTCQDSPRNWHDSEGTRYDCAWYAQYDFCERYSNLFENFGKTASSACCVCGGGTTGITAPTAPTRPSRPSPRPTPRPTSRPTRTDLNCRDIPNWHDKGGEKFNCDWYAVDYRCDDYGSRYFNYGINANTACCVCGGGF